MAAAASIVKKLLTRREAKDRSLGGCYNSQLPFAGKFSRREIPRVIASSLVERAGTREKVILPPSITDSAGNGIVEIRTNIADTVESH